MRTNRKVFLTLMLALASITMNSQKLQFGRPAGYDGLNTFETKKNDTTTFEKIKVKVGGDFALQFQGLDHSNDMNNLAAIGSNVNLPSANLNLDVQLAEGVRMHLRTYLSSRHHNETWVKGGYLQIDRLNFVKDDFLKDVMDIATIRIGVDQPNYGDAHFRRSDNAMAIYNPFVGNYIMDSFTVEPFVEVNVMPGDFVFVGGITNGVLSPTVDNTIKPWGSDTVIGEKDNKITFYGKLGWDSQINEDLRVRLTGSVYSARGFDNGDHIYSGDRAGGRYYNIFNSVDSDGEFVYGGDFSGRFDPGFKNNTSFQFNPFVKFNGLEFFGIYEVNTGSKVDGNEEGEFTQLGAELLYRFGSWEQFYVGGRYNSVSGNGDYTAGGTQPNTQEIDRTNIGAGWFMTKNILMKLEYVKQSYNSDASAWSPNAWTPATLSGAEMNGFVVEAVISF